MEPEFRESLMSFQSSHLSLFLISIKKLPSLFLTLVARLTIFLDLPFYWFEVVSQSNSTDFAFWSQRNKPVAIPTDCRPFRFQSKSVVSEFLFME
jgi:hypothetical protein